MSRLRGPLVERLCNLAPCFPLQFKDINILYSAEQFYEALKKNISSAKKRIIMSSLYFGSGQREQTILDLIHNNMETHEDLKTNILLDFSRFFRDKTVLKKLEKFEPRFNFSLFSPNFLNFGEIWGVQHMKYYITDDTVIITGANLSSDYLSDRLDRYFVIKENSNLIEFLSDLHKIIEGHSNFKNAGLKNHVEDLFHRFKDRSDISSDILIFPFVQLGSSNICMEDDFFELFFGAIKRSENLYFSTAYFNPSLALMRNLGRLSSNFQAVTSSPAANSFFAASGYKSYVVPFYEEIQRSVYSCVDGLKLFQWKADSRHKTFHAKGIWAFDCEQEEGDKVTMTVMGSSNFGLRSLNRDLELQFVVVTNNKNIEEELRNEVNSIFSSTQEVSRDDLPSPSEKLPFYLKPFTFIVKQLL